MRNIQNRVNFKKYIETLYAIYKRINQTIHFLRKQNISYKKLQKLIKKFFTTQFNMNNYNKIQKFKNISCFYYNNLY